MNNEQGGQGEHDSGRPAIMDTLSDTQLQELEQNFDEQDQEGWMTLARSYGWSDDQWTAVWNWFGQKPIA